MAYIYEITNNINNKSYIGKTESTIEKRFTEHCREAFREQCQKRPLYSAMRKYGVEHFSIKLLEETAEPENREMYWIAKKQTYRYGYNATLGGDGRRYVNQNEVIELYGKLKNQKLVAAQLSITSDTVGKILHANGISTVNPLVQRKAVEQFTLLGEPLMTFDSCSNAARFLIENNYSSAKLNTVTNKITECANKHRKSAYGYLWRFK